MKKNILLVLLVVFTTIFTACTRDLELTIDPIDIESTVANTQYTSADITVTLNTSSLSQLDVWVHCSTTSSFNSDDAAISVQAHKNNTRQYKAQLYGLTDNTHYYYKVSLVNSVSSVEYGPYEFSTQEILAPSLSTTAVSSVSYSTATFSSAVTADGGSDIIERGFCWGTSVNPTLESNSGCCSSSLGGALVNTATGLNDGTTYHVRAYARNTKSVGFSEDVSFSTIAYNSPFVTTLPFSSDNISYTWVTAKGRIDGIGGESIVARGFYYGTSPNPYPNGQKVNADGQGTGTFSKTINGLQSGTTYYICAYAQNNGGKIGTGEVVSVTTK